MPDYELMSGQQIRFTVDPRENEDGSGAEMPIDGAPTAEITGGDAVALPGNGPLEAVVRTAAGYVGDVYGTLKADVVLGDGVKYVEVPFRLIVSARPAPEAPAPEPLPEPEPITAKYLGVSAAVEEPPAAPEPVA